MFKFTHVEVISLNDNVMCKFLEGGLHFKIFLWLYFALTDILKDWLEYLKYSHYSAKICLVAGFPSFSCLFRIIS